MSRLLFGGLLRLWACSSCTFNSLCITLHILFVCKLVQPLRECQSKQMQSINLSKDVLGGLCSGTTARSTGDSQLMSSKYTVSQKTVPLLFLL